MYEFLKDNAEYFERKAFEALNEKPRFVLFFVERSLQLYLKYILAKSIGDYPKTHKLRILFLALLRIEPKAKGFYDDNADIIDLIEEAYITARYLGKEYSQKSARRALELLKSFKEVFKEWIV